MQLIVSPFSSSLEKHRLNWKYNDCTSWVKKKNLLVVIAVNYTLSFIIHCPGFPLCIFSWPLWDKKKKIEHQIDGQQDTQSRQTDCQQWGTWTGASTSLPGQSLLDGWTLIKWLQVNNSGNRKFTPAPPIPQLPQSTWKEHMDQLVACLSVYQQ